MASLLSIAMVKITMTKASRINCQHSARQSSSHGVLFSWCIVSEVCVDGDDWLVVCAVSFEALFWWCSWDIERVREREYPRYWTRVQI